MARQMKGYRLEGRERYRVMTLDTHEFIHPPPSLPTLRQPNAHHRDLLAGATAQAPPDTTSREDPDRHLMMTISEPSKPFPCLVAPQPATAQVAPMLPSPRNSRTGLDRHTGPEITRTHRPPTYIAILTAQPTLAADLSCGPPSAKNFHSKRAGTAQCVPLPAVSSLGVYRTPAAARGETFVTAGVRYLTIADVAVPSMHHGSWCKLTCELPTGCAEVLSIIGSADARGGRALQHHRHLSCGAISAPAAPRLLE
jgi:hypothetical protein